MKLLTLQVDQDMAQRILKEYEEGLSEKRNERNDLSEEIGTLEHQVKILREQLQGANGAVTRSPSGANKAKILAFLQAIPNNKGAKMKDIAVATGIGTSSVNFTLTNKNNSGTFVKEGMLWKIIH